MTESTAEATVDRDLEGIRDVLEYSRSQLGDKLAETYYDLWDVATESEESFSSRRVSEAELELFPDKRRRAKVVRRLGILTFAAPLISYELERAQRIENFDVEPTLEELFEKTLSEIAELYEIPQEEIDHRVKGLETGFYALPEYFKAAGYTNRAHMESAVTAARTL